MLCIKVISLQNVIHSLLIATDNVFVYFFSYSHKAKVFDVNETSQAFVSSHSFNNDVNDSHPSKRIVIKNQPSH